MRARHAGAFVLGFLVCLFAGCANVRDISEQGRYEQYVGTTDTLCRNCELWKNGHPAKYVILVPTAPLAARGIESPTYAVLPEGTQVKIEGFQQETDKRGKPYDYAVVTLDDPKHPERRIHAGVRFQFLQGMSALER